MTNKKRYALVGTGGRSYLYTEALSGRHREDGELAAICDSNAGRLRLSADYLSRRGVQVKTYMDGEFDRMIAETRPDTVIVTTPCYTHSGYITRAMELGVDVITEKAMTTGEQGVQRILDTRRQTGRACRVTFNARYAPAAAQVKDLLMSGVIGDVLSVDFHWLLDTTHGADYFRRWHSSKAMSGGLQVHKATHHFDLVNWWLSAIPETIYATGGRFFYTPHTADRYGLARRTDRCLTCPESGKCPFFLDLRASPDMAALYLENEPFDGYHRDQCVFRPEIDIEDTIHAVIGYRGGLQVSYSLHAYSPWEGFIVTFAGTKGRLEHTLQQAVYISGGSGDSHSGAPGEPLPDATRTRIIPHFQSGYDVEVWKGEGSHGGGDPLLLEQLFSPTPPADPYLRAADERSGAWSVMIGAAVNRSLEWGRAVRIDELVHGLADPDYPSMPSAVEPIDPRPLKALDAHEHFLHA